MQSFAVSYTYKMSILEHPLNGDLKLCALEVSYFLVFFSEGENLNKIKRNRMSIEFEVEIQL